MKTGAPIAEDAARSTRGILPPFETVDPREVRGWDEWVRQHPCGTVFHTTGWCSVLAETYGYKPVYLLARERSRPIAALPLMEVDSWMTGRRGISLPFTDSCDPLLPKEASGEDVFRAAEALGTRRDWKYLECRGELPALATQAPSLQFYNHMLDLNRPLEEVTSKFHPSVRRAIRKAEVAGVEVSTSPSLVDIQSYYSLHCLTRKRHGLPPQPYKFFHAIWASLIDQGQGFVVLAKTAGKAVAGALFLRFGAQAVYKFGASDAAAQNLRPNNLVMAHAIQHLLQTGASSLDFGRTSFSQDGLRRFKLGWGAAERMVRYAKYNFQAQSFVQEKDAAHGRRNAVFRSLPMWVNRQIGAFLYRHIA